MTDIRQEFRRSSRFGIVGVVVVMVLCAAIALVFGSNSAHPTGALIAIFVIVFGFVGVMLHLQRRDVDGAEAHAKFEATSPTEPVTDPTLATQTSLLADLAVKPIDEAALAAASGGVWGWARSNLRNEWVLIVLIACAVIPWQLWQSKWSLIIFVPLILLFVGYLAIRLLMPGGTLQQAYDSALPTLDALGFSEAERPELKIRRQPLGPQPFKHGMEGASVYTRKPPRSRRLGDDRGDPLDRLGRRSRRVVRGQDQGRDPARRIGRPAGGRGGDRAAARLLLLEGGQRSRRDGGRDRAAQGRGRELDAGPVARRAPRRRRQARLTRLF